MAPRADEFKRLRQRLRRSLHYGDLRMNCLTIPLSQMVVDYFDHHSPYDYLDMDFAASLSRDGCIDPCTLVAAMIYLERLRISKPKTFCVTNPNDLYLAAIMVATKFMNDCGLDEFVWNDEWAATVGMSVNRINQLELRMVDDLNWDLMITDQEFNSTLASFERYIASRSLKSIGFLSYGDVNVLATDLRPFLEHTQRFMGMCCTLMTAYLMAWSAIYGAYYGLQTAKKIASEVDPQTSTNFSSIELGMPEPPQEVYCFEAEEFEKIYSSVTFDENTFFGNHNQSLGLPCNNKVKDQKNFLLLVH